jgi:putative ABC transport system permease protein
VAVATLLAAMVASIVFGALPALQASRTRAAMVLRATDGRTTTSRSRSRSALVVLEIALTLVLLVAAGLLSSTLAQLQRVDSGYAVDQVTVGRFTIPQTRYPDSDAQIAFYRRLTEALDTRPEFTSAALGFPAPLAGQNASGHFTVVGQATPPGDERPFGHINSVSPGFFKTMGIPILAGRAFEARDLGESKVAIISQTAARRYWPDTDPVGRQLRFDEGESPFTIVGVTGDVRQLGLREDPPALVYFPYTQFPLPFMTLAARSPLSDAAVATALIDVLQQVDAELPVPNVQTLASLIDRSLADARFRTFVFGVLAMVALALAAVGVYGLVSYSVSQQTREIGIRVALGASPRQVLRTIVLGGALLALAGVAVGLVGALFVVRSLASFLFGVGTTDPTVFISVSLVLLAVATLASYLPARRALRVDPMTALRTE